MSYRRYLRVDPRRYMFHYLTKFGRRGAVLTILGIMWIATGIGIMITPPSEVYFLLSGWKWLRGLVWIGTGLLALWFARKPQGEDALGFGALYLAPAFRVVAYGTGGINYLIEPEFGAGGSARAIVQVFTWTTIIIVIAVMAGWSEPEPRATEDRLEAAS